MCARNLIYSQQIILKINTEVLSRNHILFFLLVHPFQPYISLHQGWVQIYPKGVVKSCTVWPQFPELEIYQDTQDHPRNNFCSPGMVDIVLFCLFLTLAASSRFHSHEKFPNSLTTVITNTLLCDRIHTLTGLQNPQASPLLLTESCAMLQEKGKNKKFRL